MTEIEKIAEKVLTEIYDIVEGVDNHYDERELAILQDAFRQVAERTREECLKHGKTIMVRGLQTEIIFASDIRNAKWEDEKA